MTAHLLTYDYPPRRGGIARYNAAVVAALGSTCTVHVFPPSIHWTRIVVALFRDRIGKERRAIFLTSEVLPLGIVVCGIAWLTRGTSIIMCHGLDLGAAIHVSRRRWLLRRVLTRVDRIIANSANTARQAIAAGAPRDRVTVVYPPLGVRRAAGKTPDPSNGGSIVLSVGRLIPRKGFDTLIDAVALARETMPQLTLRIIGDGPLHATLITYARVRNVPLTLDADADDAALARAYASCSVFALLPRMLSDGDVEGFGIVYLEAGSFGKPVIGTTSGGVPEAVRDGVTGILVPPDDARAAAVAIITCCADSKRSAAFGAAGRERAEGECSDAAFTAAVRRALLL